LSRYKAVIGERDYRKACLAIQKAGYATAPTYAQTLIKLIEQYGLAQYDGENFVQSAKKDCEKQTISALDEVARQVRRATGKTQASRIWQLERRHISAKGIEDLCLFFCKCFGREINPREGFWVPNYTEDGGMIGKIYADGSRRQNE
jgi:hypothetical protein